MWQINVNVIRMNFVWPSSFRVLSFFGLGQGDQGHQGGDDLGHVLGNGQGHQEDEGRVLDQGVYRVFF